MPGAEHYVVYLDAPGIYGTRGTSAVNWTWCRVRGDGRLVTQGPVGPTMQACFKAVRRHMEHAGKAPIRIDLNGSPVEEAPAVVALSITERDVTISDSRGRAG